MKKVFVAAALSLAAAFAPAASAQEKPELPADVRAGILIGYAELCQRFGRLLDDPRLSALTKELGSADFHEQRLKIRDTFREAKKIKDIDEVCLQVDKQLDQWAKVYYFPPKNRQGSKKPEAPEESKESESREESEESEKPGE